MYISVVRGNKFTPYLTNECRQLGGLEFIYPRRAELTIWRSGQLGTNQLRFSSLMPLVTGGVLLFSLSLFQNLRCQIITGNYQEVPFH